MKRVLLLRHAKSSWSDPDCDDHDRPLASRGERDAKRLAREFLAHSPKPDLVLCSSAKRARKTYAVLARKVSELPKPQIVPALYLPTLDTLLEVIHGVPDDIANVMVVGHSPSLDAFLLSFVTLQERGLRERIEAKLPTCSLCVIEFPVTSFAQVGGTQGKLSALVTPDDLDDQAPPRELQPVKANLGELSKHASVLETARAAIGGGIAQMRANAAGAKLGDDPEFAHQLRVGVRRLRVALRLFATWTDVNDAERLQDELRWLFRELGPVREHDVFLTELVEPALERSAQSGVVALRDVLREERDASLRRARKAIRSARYAELMRRLLVLETELDAADDNSPPARRWAKKRLDKRLEKLAGLRAALETRNPGELHELRKQLKKLRYAADFLRHSFSRKHVRTYLARLSELQDVLGGLMDVSFEERILERALPRIESNRARAQARDIICTAFDARATQHALQLADALQAVLEEKPFWH